jgi:hypothetical protein
MRLEAELHKTDSDRVKIYQAYDMSVAKENDKMQTVIQL